MKARNPRPVERFLEDGLGFKFSDRMGSLASWWHCDADHHGMAVVRAPKHELSHDAYAYPDLSAMGRVADRLKRDCDQKLMWGISRHGPGNNHFAYFHDNDGAMIELCSDLAQMPPVGDYRARKWPVDPTTINQWGGPPPLKFLLTGYPIAPPGPGCRRGRSVRNRPRRPSGASTMPSNDLLWPTFRGPADLAEIERVPLEERGLPASTYELVTRAACLWPDRPAVSVLADAEHFDTPLTLTFAQLARDVHRAATVLGELGIGRDDAVAVVSVNCATMLPLLLAAEAVGIFAPINPGLSADHATELVRRSGARVVAASGPELDPTAWALARVVAQRTGARALLAMRPTAVTSEAPPLEPLGGVEVAYLEERMADADDGALPGPPPSSSDIASYLHTGGTTGTPKLAARTHSNEVSNAWMIACSDLLDQDSVTFAALPLFHTNALLVTVLAPLLKGQHVVWGGPLGYRDTSLFGNFWKIVGRHRIAAMSAVPTVYSVLAQVPVDADISSLKLPIVGAAPLSPAVASAFETRTGVALCEGYGLTEGTCASARGWPTAQRSGTVGQRLPYQEAATVHVDEITGEWTFLPEGAVGTLVLRGPNVFAGYLAEGESGPELRPGDKLRHGWLDTGDLARIEADGFIRLAGRAKDLIIRGGHNIDPATIEDALLAHPEVTAAAAVGRPDAHAGEIPVAFVTLARESELTPDHLLAWAASRAPERAAAPKHVEILDDIPLTAVGKQYKPELRRRAAQQAAREALAGTSVYDHVSAVLVDGSVEVHVPQSLAGDEIGAALSQFAWSWKFIS